MGTWFAQVGSSRGRRVVLIVLCASLALVSLAIWLLVPPHQTAGSGYDFMATREAEKAAAIKAAMKTAIAQMTPTAVAHRHPYRAPIPGPGCDAGGAIWTPGYGVITCLLDGMLLTQQDGKASVTFNGTGDYYLIRYTVAVEVSQIQPGACPYISPALYFLGIYEGGFRLAICRDGSVAVDRYESPYGGPNYGPSTRYFSGHVAPGAAYRLEVTCAGADCSFSVNGTLLTSISYPSFGPTRAIILGLIHTNPGDSFSAEFKNFVFTLG